MKQTSFKRFMLVGAVLFPLLVLVNTIWLRFLITKEDSIFFVLAAALVLSWILILTLYYVWAIYFYNVNLGWTDYDWKNHEQQVIADPTVKEPEDNPNHEHTLGLPPGTVRGTIALSVLVGGLAMLIASLAMPGKYNHNEFLVDNFEYIKTAFLMVIAFYFGSKSLELIERKQVINAPNGSTASSDDPSSPPPAPASSGSPKTSNNTNDVNVPTKDEFFDPTAKG